MKKLAVFLVAVGLLLGREAFGVTQLVTNGGFELGSIGWVPALNLVNVPVVTNQPAAHSGNMFLNLGNVNGTISLRVYQTVTIPTNTVLALYSFYWTANSNPPGDLAGSATLTPLVLSTSQAILFNPGSAPNGSSPYAQQTFDLTSFAGQTVELAFQEDAGPGVGVRSSFSIDDVSLLAFTTNDIPANDNFANATVLSASTNISVLVTNTLATKEPGEPKHTGNAGGHSVWWTWTAPSNGVVTINTLGSTFNTLLAAYTGDVVSNLTQVAENDDQNSGQGIVTSQVKFSVIGGTPYKIVVDGKAGASGIAQLNLSFAPDTKAPTVSITSPKSGTKLTTDSLTIQGKATDNLGIALVQVRLENANGTNDYQDADGTNTWTANVTGLIPGPNTIRVRAIDISDNTSPAVTTTVSYVVVSPITVSITGSGTVTPNLNGQSLAVGDTFKMTAKPAKGQVFSNWVGTITSTDPALTFVMQSNMVLQANFTPNPFTPVAATYQGLFYDTNNPAHQSSGFFSATITTSGSFSAKMIIAGTSASLSGQFSAGGVFSGSITRKGLTPVSAQLQLDFSTGQITGQLSDGTWTAQLIAGRAATANITPALHYTLLIPGADTSVTQPGGDSYGTVTMSTKGAISFSGVLADGSKVTQKGNVLVNGQWPFYVSLYSGKGSIFGWLTFSNTLDSDISGNVEWIKPPNAGGLYPAGFTNFVEATGSAYAFTKGAPVLNFSTGLLSLSNGNLISSIFNQFTLDSASKITSTNSTLKMTITTASGLFKGTITNPDTGKPISLNGVVLQKQNSGSGFFLGTTQAGRVTLHP